MNESVLECGRPGKGSRSAIEERCYDFLDSLNIEYTRVDHEAAATMEALHEAEHVLGCRIAKNLFLTNRQQTEFYLLIMTGDKSFKTKYLSAQLGCSRLSFASEELLTEKLSVHSGSASILTLIDAQSEHLTLVIDKDLCSEKTFACHPCINTSTVAFSFDALNEKLIPALRFEPFYVELPQNPE